MALFQVPATKHFARTLTNFMWVAVNFLLLYQSHEYGELRAKLCVHDVSDALIDRCMQRTAKCTTHYSLLTTHYSLLTTY